jgi:hypothetical protein
MCHDFLQIPAVHPGLLLPVDEVGSCQGLHHTGVSAVCLNFEMATFNNVSGDFAGGGQRQTISTAIWSTKIMKFYLQNFGRLQ